MNDNAPPTSQRDATHKFSFFVACCFTLNYIIGSGFLTLPWAFYETGWALGLLVLTGVTVLSIVASWFILEAMARAELLVQHYGSAGTNHHGSPLQGSGGSADMDDLSQISSSGSKSALSINKASNGGTGGYYTLTPMLTPKPLTLAETSAHALLSSSSIRGEPSSISSLAAGAGLKSVKFDPDAMGDVKDCESCITIGTGTDTRALMVGARKFEMPELCELFLGAQVRRCYTVIIAVYMYGTLWAYSAVFANAFASQLPIKNGHSVSYCLYLAVFACCVVPASLLELSEQVYMQVSLSGCRLLMLGGMVLTVWNAHSYDVDAFGDLGETKHEAVVWSPSRVYLLLPIAAYANIFHHSIPALSQPVASKADLAHVFTTSLLVSLGAYCAIGIVVSTYFGEHTQMASNLNWRSYVGLTDESGNVPMYARMASFFIVLFPAFDVASAFPLNAITLGNNMMSTFYGSHYARMEKNRFHRCIFRLLAACPPILLAFCESNLGEITDFTGLTGFAVAFIFPALLSIYSERRLRDLGLPTRTQYSNILTKGWSQSGTLVIGAFLVVFVTASLVALGPPTQKAP